MKALNAKQLGRLVVGLLALLFSIGYTQLAFQLNFGTLERPGPGMWPRVVGIAIVVISILTILEAVWRPEEDADIGWPRGGDKRRFLGFSALMVIYILALPYLGFLTSSLLMAVIGMRVLSPMSWKRISLISAGVVGVTYYLFLTVLNVRFLSGWLI